MENALTKEELKTLDELLSSTFNSILRIEERSLNNRLTEGLSIAELHTICAVGLHEANPMKVIANRLGITLATLTVMINKLEKRSYVKRERSEKDRRQVLVALTAKGRKAMRAHDAFHKKMVESALADLTPEEEGVFVKAVGKVKAFFDNEAEKEEQKGSSMATLDTIQKVLNENLDIEPGNGHRRCDARRSRHRFARHG